MTPKQGYAAEKRCFPAVLCAPEDIRAASQDRRNIYDYLEERNPIAAIEIDDLIEEKTDLLVDNRLMGRTGRQKDTRELVIHPHYVVVYDITDIIRILRVLHTSQEWS